MNLNDTENADATKFRLIGRSVLSYRFIIPHAENLFVGDILKITDTAKGYSFYAKVSDLIHESNFADEKWDTRPFSEHFYGLGEDVFLGVEAVPLGFVDGNGVFRKPRTVPTKFSQVTIPEAGDFAFLTKVMGDIEVGVMRTGQGVLKDVPVKIHSKVLPQHMGVFATTGMGKSNFMKTFCASCMKVQQFGLLMVDPHGEYVRGGQSSTGERTLGLVHYTAGRDGLAVFTISDADRKKYGLSSLWLDYDDFRMTDLALLYDLSQAQRDAIESLEEFEGKEIIPFFLQANVDTLPDAVKAGTYAGPFPAIAEKLAAFHPGTLGVIQRRIRNIVSGNRKFFRESGSSVTEILRHLHDNKVVLIDIPRMGERSELFVLSMITRRIMQAHRKSAEEFGTETEPLEQKKVLITIEEAQRVLSAGGSSTQIFRECAMEGRKFGVGLCVITQQPKNVDPKVLAQINTFVVMGLGDRGDREIIMGSAKQDLSKMEIEIQTLDRGEAIISTIGIPFPVSTRIHYYEDYIAGLNTERKRDIKEGLSSGFS
ncbi:MAG: ATP-binding protein [Methanoregula sp.]|jgi:DNA helicase HerA-like ATPase|uniref:ATP-binding protein n=1 Tax=Methanoregula sp. TaxID=2052170 RepID=UPI003D142733